LREYSRTKSEILAQIRATMAELQHFSKGLFFYWRTQTRLQELCIPGESARAVWFTITV